MELDNLTVREVKELVQLAAGFGCAKQGGHPYGELLGKGVFIRTVTHHYTGRLVAVYDQEFVIEDAAWIADDGRFADFLKTGEAKEVEPYPAGRLIVGRGAVIDIGAFGPALPKSQK